MAQWKETLEPYIKVQERIKTATLNPTAGEDLIIGAVIISDAGPSTPTLVTSQSEFKELYASRAISEDYMSTLGKLYDDDNTVAPTMWENAYRLAGSNSMLIVRATKADGVNVIQPLDTTNTGEYIVKDGQVLKKVGGFKLSIDKVFADLDGWGIDLCDVGKIGCRITDTGVDYDYFVNTIPELVKQLNASPNFYSPNYVYQQCTVTKVGNVATGLTLVKDNLDSTDPTIDTVYFKEVYVGANLVNENIDGSNYYNGLSNLVASTSISGDEDPSSDPNQSIINLLTYCTFSDNVNYYAVNTNNSASDLRIRIRRFNHDAVVSRDIDTNMALTKTSPSPYSILENVITAASTGSINLSKDRDFYEIAIQDSTISDGVNFYNVGNLPGRGDISVDELNSLTSMISFVLPEDLDELGLNYYGIGEFIEYTGNDLTLSSPSVIRKSNGDPFNNKTGIYSPEDGKYYAIVDTVYEYTTQSQQIYRDLNISTDPVVSSILKVTMDDLKDALTLLSNDEIYTVEGLTDLGMTDPTYQNAVATLAINENYFYPISTVNSSNYMVIANKFKTISMESSKLYGLSPWDIDTATLGWKYYTSPSVMYWETVARNRRNNQEFRSTFGQVGGIIQYQRPTTEFNKKTRQLLLSKKINTALWNNTTQAWNINDNYTKQSEDNILSDDANSRLFIRISKAQPTLLKQFIGRRITEKLCKDIEDTIIYWFNNTILPMEYSIDDYRVFCVYDEALARKNKVKVIINVRFQRALKFIEVYNNAFDVGMSIEGME